MKISQKLTLGYVLLALFVGLMLCIVTVILQQIHRAYNEVDEEYFPVILSLENIKYSGLRIVSSTSEFGFITSEMNVTGTDNLKASHEEELIESGNRIYENFFKKFQVIANQFYPEYNEFINEIETTGGLLQKTSHELIQLKKQGVSGQKILDLKEKFEEEEKSFLKVVDKALAHEKKELAEAYNHLNSSLAIAIGLISTVGLLLIIIVLIFGFLISRSISEPITQLKEAVVQVGKRQFNTKIDIRTNDEVGILASAFNKMTQELAKSEHQLHSILNNSTAIIFVKDVESRYLLINRQYEELFHITNQEIQGKTDYDLFPKERAEAFRQNEQTILKTLQTTEYQETVPQDDGLHTYISVKFPLYDIDMKPYGVGCIATDITEWKQLESQLLHAQKMEALGTMAGGFAHEFNNILFQMSGYTEILLNSVDKASPEQQKAELTHVLQAGNRAKELVKQILTFSRMETTGFKPIDVAFVIQEALKMIRVTMPANVEILLDLQQECSRLMANSAQIHEIVLNLCTNACHAMEATGGILKISLREIERCPLPSCVKACSIRSECIAKNSLTQGGTCLELMVEDTGHGITLEDQKKIFDPFFTTKEVGKGTGLGLATVHGIVQKHKGVITVESQVGQGATFKVFLPIVT
ncbi:ATP-binding protein [Deltaproteobacteria bacterium TL4]